jgi:molybdate transport system substrate-binding protein
MNFRTRTERISGINTLILFFLPVIYISTVSADYNSGNLTIAAASDMKYAMEEIVYNFKILNPDAEIRVIFGSSGNFYRQIINDAPFDIYFSADIFYPEQLETAGLTISDIRLYAVGRIVIWSSTLDVNRLEVETLRHENVHRIAIANPEHAPYGKRALEFLERQNLMNDLRDKLVYGENISQAAHFAYTGAAQAGIIALSLALSQQMQEKGSYWLIPEEFHNPLEQGYVLLKGAGNNPLAHEFSEYMVLKEVRNILDKYGFTLPEK